MKTAKRVFLIGLVFSLLSLNVATIVSATAYNALYSLLSHVPIPSLFDNSIKTKHKTSELKNTALIKKQKKEMKELRIINKGFINVHKKIPSIVNRIRNRTAKIAITGVATIPAESVPILGIVTILTAAGMEVYLSCENMKDLDKINNIVNPNNPNNQSDKVCGLQVPTIKEIKSKIGL
ncbi:MAG: hypothetical protein Ctma_1338 [Catillopecten margaritatus gill symbiont]|uniref:Uncharacterized protein n=1 Tax=Catillopecten margaritatus gill symbiont TaxID=3083288 RepID=A0AAU6PHZ8_9GAMM